MSETARWTGPAPPQRGRPAQQQPGGRDGANLADILERVLDNGIVIAGDIQVNLLDIELLTIKIRLVVASVDRAKEMGIDWWERDPTLSAGRRELEDENRELRARIEALERGDRSLPSDAGEPEGADEPGDADEPGSDRPDTGPGPDEIDAAVDAAAEDAAEEEDVEEEDVDEDVVDDADAGPDRADGRDRPSSKRGRRGAAGGRSRRDDAGRGIDDEAREAPVRRRPGARRSAGGREG